MALLFFSFELCVAIGIPEKQAFFCGVYCRNMIPSMMIFCHTDLQREFQNALKLTYGPSLAEFVALVLHFGWLKLFVSDLGMGVEGAAHAMTISQAVSYLFMLVFQKHFLPKHHPIHLMARRPKFSALFKTEMLDQLLFGLTCAVP
jgi:Na+-driven multidrug efflux pump